MHLITLAGAAQIQQSIEIQVTLPQDTIDYIFTAGTLSAHPNGDFYWYGDLTSSSFTCEEKKERSEEEEEKDTLGDCLSGYLSIIGKNGKVFGQMRIDTTSYHIPYLGGSLNGLVEIKSQKEEVICISDGTPHPEAGNPEIQERNICPVVRLLILYTQGAIDAFPDVENIAMQAYFDTKQALVNSDIPITQLDLFLTGIELLPGFTPSSSFNNSKTPILATNSNARQLREQYEADLVIILTPDVFTAFNGAVFSFGDTEADGETAFAFVEVPFATAPNFTFAHEFAHLFGARHHNMATCSANGHDDTGLTYAHGYIFDKGACDFCTNPRYYKTVVAPCIDNTQRVTILHYSNPDIKYKKKKTGTSGTNNNARVLKDATCRISSYVGSRDIGVYIQNLGHHFCPGQTFTAYGGTTGVYGPYQYQWRYKMNSSAPWSGIVNTNPYQDNLTLTVPANFFGVIYIELTATNGTDTETYSVGVLSDYLSCPHNRPAEDAGIKTVPSLDIFPNPASDHIQLRLSRPVSGKTQIVVMNMLGKVYYSQPVHFGNSTEDQFVLDLPGIPEGQYMVVIQTEDFQQISQFTVLK